MSKLRLVKFTPAAKGKPLKVHIDRYRVLVNFGDRRWDKRFRTLTEAKWSQNWAIESGAISATILEDRRS